MSQVNQHVRFEPDEHPPLLMTLGAGVQGAMIIVGAVVLGVVIVMRVGDQSQSYTSWAVFAALLVSGSTTVLQAVRFWRFGSGHILIMGTSGAFLAACVAALANGGPALMASLIVASSLMQFLIGMKLSLTRRIFVPVVTGTVIMLIAATVMPIAFGLLDAVEPGQPVEGAMASAAVTLAITVGLVLRAPPSLRLWSPVIGIAAGTATAAVFGLYDTSVITEAAWIGAPFEEWPGLSLDIGANFWALLPAFAMVTAVGAIETLGDGVAIQRVSRRTPPAPDFRVAQGAINADGVGNLLSGLSGTVPNTTYSSSVAMVEITGVGARRVGVVIGLTFILFAFFPKITAILVAIPSPVAGAYMTVLIGLLFVQGMKIVINDGVDHRKAAIIGLAFWAGVGFTNAQIFGESLGDGFMSLLLENGMTGGAIVALIMVLFLELTSQRRKRIRLEGGTAGFTQLRDFLQDFAQRTHWSEDATGRLTLVGEEALSGLLTESDTDSDDDRKAMASIRMVGTSAELELVSGPSEGNLEDRLALLGESPEITDENELSYRLLRHYAASVRHSKYYGLDIVTVHVERAD
ncbi:MAG: hypothetical protein OXC55_06920 [Chloroflexi bacterium]|nr:hypothetical protein [Chloroflexota bacterium]